MNLKLKPILLSLMLLAMLAFFGGCAAEASPYEQNDAQGKTLSIRFDANGGFFTTNTSVIVDSYDPAALPSKDGKVSVPLLSPDDKARGNDAFAPVNNGYFLAGWYAERTQSEDANGNIQYTYGKKWDFEKDRLEVAAQGSYSSSEPVLTLYAAWVPLFKVEFYDLATGDYLNELTFDPAELSSIQVPQWSQETGAMQMFKFPKREGYTFRGAYYDAEGTQPVTEEQIIPTGRVDEATGTAVDPVMKLYVDWQEGEWYHIYSVEQFLDNASVGGSYEIHADLDFSGEIWPTALMYGNFSGSIHGNGHTFKNIDLQQTNNSKTNAGLFGVLTDTAKISDLTLENVTFTIKSGTRVAGTSYGLLCGTVSAKAEVSNVAITAGVLQVDSDCYFGTDEYVIGLVCGSGTTGIDASGITAKAVGDAPEKVSIAVDGQSVSVEIALE